MLYSFVEYRPSWHRYDIRGDDRVTELDLKNVVSLLTEHQSAISKFDVIVMPESFTNYWCGILDFFSSSVSLAVLKFDCRSATSSYREAFFRTVKFAVNENMCVADGGPSVDINGAGGGGLGSATPGDKGPNIDGVGDNADDGENDDDALETLADIKHSWTRVGVDEDAKFDEPPMLIYNFMTQLEDFLTKVYFLGYTVSELSAPTATGAPTSPPRSPVGGPRGSAPSLAPLPAGPVQHRTMPKGKFALPSQPVAHKHSLHAFVGSLSGALPKAALPSQGKRLEQPGAGPGLSSGAAAAASTSAAASAQVPAATTPPVVQKQISTDSMVDSGLESISLPKTRGTSQPEVFVTDRPQRFCLNFHGQVCHTPTVNSLPLVDAFGLTVYISPAGGFSSPDSDKFIPAWIVPEKKPDKEKEPEAEEKEKTKKRKSKPKVEIPVVLLDVHKTTIPFTFQWQRGAATHQQTFNVNNYSLRLPHQT